MAEYFDLLLDEAYQPLLGVELALRKRGARDDDAELVALAERVWAVVEALQALQRRLEAAEALMYAPGDWICPTCGFVQSQRVLHVASGQIGTSDEPALPCPNDGQYMERLTWKQMAKGLQEISEDLLQRATAGEKDTARLDAISKPGAMTRVSMRALENKADPPMRRYALATIPEGPHSSVSVDRPTLREAIDAAGGLK